ncbi:hypothetical protein GOP47_0023119, partial [Adiantum capillus-veneris]
VFPKINARNRVIRRTLRGKFPSRGRCVLLLPFLGERERERERERKRVSEQAGLLTSILLREAMENRLRAVLGIPGPDKSRYTGIPVTGIIDSMQFYLHYFLDTPAYSLSRMCDAFQAGNFIALTNEVQCFWGRAWPQKKKELKRWRVRNIPCPAVETGERRIIMACLTEQLADAFNELISRGLPRGASLWDEFPKGTSFELESPPAWCNLIMNPKGIHIHINNYNKPRWLDNDECCSANFLKRGIRIDKHIMYFA